MSCNEENMETIVYNSKKPKNTAGSSEYLDNFDQKLKYI